MKNLVTGKSLRILVSFFCLYGDRIQVKCGNRLDYEGKRKTKQHEVHESVILSERMKNLSLTKVLSGVCRSNPVAENIEEAVIVNTKCNIDRNPRFVNRKTKSYDIILRNV